MNVCAKCGQPMASGVMSCPACGGLPVRVVAPGTGWQRWAAAGLGLLLLVVGTLALSAGTACDYESCSPQLRTFVSSAALAAMAVGAGAVFLAAWVVLPRGWYRALIGTGLGLFAASAFAFGSFLLVAPNGWWDSYPGWRDSLKVVVPSGLGAFCVAFYLGYRVAR